MDGFAGQILKPETPFTNHVQNSFLDLIQLELLIRFATKMLHGSSIQYLVQSGPTTQLVLTTKITM
ncbi:hypothetical protein FWK35_00007915 [Aphis craccivora]|uniref:Uncharacterized protein n=1 Tax=Aphis craccivora TaxID=307492 RepID=A0A6G0ZL60_APHCR|nr:hypothetical protein FWK35_00007915 [Aphis craccivora]